MGDIGWPDLYHVGDEAMTEAAVEQLRLRGVTDVTLIAADASTASAVHGTKAVPRFHFKLRWPRAWQDSHLRKVLTPLEGYVRGDGPATDVYDAVYDSDFVLIAGGGNLTSTFVHQLYERLALVRVARHFGRPVYISSQSLGATYRPADLPAIREIIDSARWFGLRERASFENAIALSTSSQRVCYTGDDALLLERNSVPAVARDSLPARYFVASFERPSWIAESEIPRYYGQIRTLLETLSTALDCHAVLVPHAGSFDIERPKDDIVSHDEIAKDSLVIHALPLLRSKDVLDIMADAEFSISTRYHPIVFAGQLGLIGFGLAHTAYTWNRMRGAARQLGGADLVMPVSAVSDPEAITEVILETLRSGEHKGRLAAASAARKENQRTWWDTIVADASSSERVSGFVELPDPIVAHPVPALRSFAHYLANEATARGVADESLAWCRETLETERQSASKAIDDQKARTRTVEGMMKQREEEVHRGLEQIRSLQSALTEAREAAASSRTELDQATEERDAWRTSARQFRAEVQRYRDRRITRLVDKLAGLVRRQK
ncbi:polysaccharide pyruvyl transferase [Curtobacterium sp. PhB130]|uniref:polysaccharide pyruvyl transferase family protein n=1 Tax=unclassified Curtobacterium TaxID=257496 RepID=UPI000F4BB4C5|nr:MULTISPECIES: polysaccharide pyruvyl transferase family protein [unclassified Curtobacterium]ROP65772.1 polysaccharide pyruvyl transferase [Curtobacterium sp. ZW137]ROS72305.1 polysaccharide pyruvyl transferase [Curtobacterium sp. PhB130]